MDPQGRKAERVLARIGGGQHGVVSRAQLLAAGVSAQEIKGRLRNGSLLVEYPGVYRIGHRAPSTEACYMAAVLACGEGALLSGRAAAHLFGLLKGPAPPPEVSAPRQRRVEGIRTRRCRRPDPRDATSWRGIPTTTVPRILVDLAAVLAEDDLARACHEAGVRYRTTPREVDAVLARRPGSRGAGKLRRVLRGDVRVTLSALERRFLQHLREAALPLPRTNRPAGGRRVDCRWPEERLTVEVDSYRYHSSRHAWELDRRREREAHARGDEFRRYTWGDVFVGPGSMLAELREVLGRSRTKRQTGEPSSRASPS
jgi:very-short-patch-repair endonuclease